MTIHNRIGPMIADRLVNRPHDTYLMASLAMDHSPNLNVIVLHVDGDVIAGIEVSEDVRETNHRMKTSDPHAVIVDLVAFVARTPVLTYINGSKISTAQFLNLPAENMHKDLKAFIRK